MIIGKRREMGGKYPLCSGKIIHMKEFALPIQAFTMLSCIVAKPNGVRCTVDESLQSGRAGYCQKAKHPPGDGCHTNTYLITTKPNKTDYE
jgi:hypothetical protein